MEERFFRPGTIGPAAGMRSAAAGGVAVALEAAARGLHDPSLEPRDEAVFLLTAAAEIEHALLVQYLYATSTRRTRCASWTTTRTASGRSVTRCCRSPARRWATSPPCRTCCTWSVGR